MIYRVPQIIQAVRRALDNNATCETLHDVGDTETLSLSECITSHIADGVRQIMATAPTAAIDTGQPLPADIPIEAVDDCGGCAILLPGDFFRLLTLRMDGWKCAVTHPITDTDPLYPLQQSPHRGVRGNPWRPVVALVRRPTGLWAECYSCESTPSVRSSLYLPMPCIDEGGGIDVPQRLFDACILAIAALTTATYADNDAYTRLTTLSQAAIN